MDSWLLKYSYFEYVVNDEDSSLGFCFRKLELCKVKGFAFLFDWFVLDLLSSQFEPDIGFQFDWSPHKIKNIRRFQYNGNTINFAYVTPSRGLCWKGNGQFADDFIVLIDIMEIDSLIGEYKQILAIIRLEHLHSLDIINLLPKNLSDLLNPLAPLPPNPNNQHFPGTSKIDRFLAIPKNALNLGRQDNILDG